MRMRLTSIITVTAPLSRGRGKILALQKGIFVAENEGGACECNHHGAPPSSVPRPSAASTFQIETVRQKMTRTVSPQETTDQRDKFGQVWLGLTRQHRKRSEDAIKRKTSPSGSASRDSLPWWHPWRSSTHLEAP